MYSSRSRSANHSLSMSQSSTSSRQSSGKTVTLEVVAVGASFRTSVETQWPCDSLISATIAEYQLAFPAYETPGFDQIFHPGVQKYVNLSEPVGRWFRDGDRAELRLVAPNKPLDLTASTFMSEANNDSSSDSTSDDRDASVEFAVLFHRLPLGFTMKQYRKSIVVATIYPHSVPAHYRRLVPGTTVMQIGDTPLAGLRLLQVHAIIKNADLPLEIRFKERTKPIAGPQPEEDTHERRLSSVFDTPLRRPSPSKVAENRKSSIPASNQDNHQRRSSGSIPPPPHSAPTRRSRNVGNVPTSIPRPAQRTYSTASVDDNNQEESCDEDEQVLYKHIELLKMQLVEKNQEMIQIARRLEQFADRLKATCAKKGKDPPDILPHDNTPKTKVRLTPEALEAMEVKHGYQPKSRHKYASSNASSISGYSSTSGHQGITRRGARRDRTRSDASVSSQTSNSSTRHNRSLNGRYSYIPPSYASASSTYEAPSSLSSRGATMSRAKYTRDSFVTKSESPGVGYYDVKMSDRVKGGDIGDSDRHLQWS